MTIEKQRVIIRPSTGWLYAREMYSAQEQATLLKSAGANCFEVCLVCWEPTDKRMQSLVGDERFDDQFDHLTFRYRSVHLPVVRYEKPEEQIVAALQVVARVNAMFAVTHPQKMMGAYPAEHYYHMMTDGIPLALENMDKTKDSGYDLAELETLVRGADCGFVLDVQHAYEHDAAMEYANDLFHALGDKLVHLHVSGETEGNAHALVSKARNAKQIVSFVSRVLSVKNVPLILEGEYTTADDLADEIRFLKKELAL